MEALLFKHHRYKNKHKVSGHKGLAIKQLRRLQDTAGYYINYKQIREEEEALEEKSNL